MKKEQCSALYMIEVEEEGDDIWSQCIRPKGHDGLHEDVEGDKWKGLWIAINGKEVKK